MKNYFVILCVTISHFCFSQIQFTRNDFGSAGDKVIYAVDSPASSGYNFGATGSNFTWRFNTKQSYPRRYDSTTFSNVTSNPKAPTIPISMLAQSIANGDQYLEVTDSFVKTMFDFQQFNVTSVKLQTLNFPLTYQSEFKDSTTAIAKGLFSDFDLDPIPPFDSIRINAKVYINSVCDGWGTIILPDTTSYNTLRVNQLISIEADIYFHSFIGWTYVTHRSQQNGSYSWYAPESKDYVARVQLDTSGNITNFIYRIQKSPVIKVAPKLLSLSPNTIMQGDTLQVTVKGFKTSFTIGTPDVYTGYCQILNTQVIDDTTLIATVYCPFSSSTGTYNFSVWTPTDGSLYLFNSFTIISSPKSPRLVSMSPNFGAVGKRVTVNVSGTNTHFTKGINVSFRADSASAGFIYVQSFTVINDTLFTCDIKIEDQAAYIPFTLVTTSTADGYLSLAGAFTITHTGLKEETNSTVLIYPNPARNELFISTPENTSSLLIQLYDVAGKEVKRMNTSGVQTRIDISDLNNHFYTIRITGDQINATKKIIVGP
jgi:hypothetical protein